MINHAHHNLSSKQNEGPPLAENLLTFFAIKAGFKFAFGTIMESSTGYNWHLNFVCNKIQTIMFWFEKSYNLLSKTFCKLTKWKFGNLVSWVFSFDKIEVWILLIRFVFLIAMCWSVFWKTIGLRSKNDERESMLFG